MTAALMAALRRLARRPLRSILTVLEVALGALAVTLALNLTQGRQLAALPPDVFRVIAGDRSESTATSYNVFQYGDLEKIRKLIPDAEVVELYVNQWGAILEYRGERFKLLGGARVGHQFNRIIKLEMLQGTFFTDKDIKSGTPPIVISQAVAKELFKDENPLGKTLQFAGGFNPPGSSPSFNSYRVLGVFRDLEASSFNTDHVFVPFLNTFGTPDGFTALSIKAQAGKSKVAQAQALEAVRQVYKDNSMFNQFKKAVYATSSSNYMQDAPGLDPQALLFAGFAIIMLITCSIGIFSIQLVDITERTKEIGMRRALGATRSMIVLESLASAFVLAGLGAVIGVLIAAPLLPIIKNATGPFLFSRGLEFSPIVALEVVGIVLVVGVLLGFYPALLASRLKPVEALREM
jgi:putative ABC transport system permease protein